MGFSVAQEMINVAACQHCFVFSFCLESSSLSNGNDVNELINRFTSALKYYSASRYNSDPQKFAKLLLILPQLKYLANQLMELLYTMKMKPSNNSIAPSELVIEMLEAKQRL